jgi:beta-glucosidase
MKRLLVYLLALLIIIATIQQPTRTIAQETPETRAKALLAQMTLDEKIGQMTLIEKNSLQNPDDVTRYMLGGILSGGGGFPKTNTPEAWAEMVDGFQKKALETRLKIPMIYGVDAVHGHGNLYGATIFPHNIGLGAANDPALMEKIGRATADEMIATGIYWNYAPVLAVLQDARWGRAYEGFGENTELVTRLAVPYIKGLQAGGVVVTAKHYVGDGGAAWGTSKTEEYKIDQGVTAGDEAYLRAVHLPPYKAAIDAGAQTVMVSFSSFGGMKMHANKMLITDVLKGELGFKGFVVSDWAGIDQVPGDAYQQTVTAINAGIDMNMQPYKAAPFIENLKKAVEAGDVPQSRIDDAVLRILTVKYAMGLFEKPFSDPAKVKSVGSAEHRQIAREAVAKSLVLLQNNNAALPIRKGQTVFVAGRHADDIGLQSGGWTIQWQGEAGNIQPGTTILKGIQDALGADNVKYDRFGNFTEKAEIGIVVVGEQPYAEGRGDNGDLQLNAREVQMIERVREQVKTLVVVIVSGRPLSLGDVDETADGIVAAWLPGTEGAGVADVLFGDKPFTGKLPISWQKDVSQLPFDLTKKLEGDAAPQFPYGFGLEK